MQLKAFHKFSYGMYLVASEYEGKKTGYIANTVFQVTSNPPQIAISCHKDNHSTQIILDSRIFTVSVLKKEVSMKILGDFGFMSSKDLNKFTSVNYIKGKSGAPIVMDSAVAWFDCKVVSSIDLGTHVLIIGEVTDSEELSADEPLTYQYYREKYKMFSPKNSPTYIDQSLLEPNKPESKSELHDEDHEPKYLFDGQSWVCVICGFTYNPEEGDPTSGIPPGTSFDDLPESYKCPICNAGKEYFKMG